MHARDGFHGRAARRESSRAGRHDGTAPWPGRTRSPFQVRRFQIGFAVSPSDSGSNLRLCATSTPRNRPFNILQPRLHLRLIFAIIETVKERGEKPNGDADQAAEAIARLPD